MQPISSIPRIKSPKPIREELDPHLRKLLLHFLHQRCLWEPQTVTQNTTWGSSFSSASSAQKPRMPGSEWEQRCLESDEGRKDNNLSSDCCSIYLTANQLHGVPNWVTSLSGLTGCSRNTTFKDSIPRNEAELSHRPKQSRSSCGTHFLG